MEQTSQGHEWFPTFTRCVSSGRLTSVWEATTGRMLLYCTAGQEGGAQAQPFHNQQPGCLGNKMDRPAWQPAVSCTADAVFLPCLHQGCSSWNSTSSQKGWGHSYVQPSSPLWEMYLSIQAAIYSRAFTELLWLQRYHRNQHITKISGRRGL